LNGHTKHWGEPSTETADGEEGGSGDFGRGEGKVNIFMDKGKNADPG